MRRYLRDPTFSRFDTIPECDGHTHTHTHTHTQTDRHTTTAYTALSKASRGKNLIVRYWINSYPFSTSKLHGATTNAGMENAIRSKLQGPKMQEWAVWNANSRSYWKSLRYIRPTWPYSSDWITYAINLDAAFVFAYCWIVSYDIRICNLASSANLPTGLYILPSVISFFFYSEQSYLSIYWTDFHDLFIKWKEYACIFLIRSIFFNSSRDVAMATNFVS